MEFLTLICGVPRSALGVQSGEIDCMANAARHSTALGDHVSKA